MCADSSHFYLATPIDCYSYLQIPTEWIPQEFLDQSKLQDKIENGCMYCEIVCGIYGLTQAGILVNKLLKEQLSKHG